MVLEAVIQALKRAEQLKKQLQNVGDLLVDGTLWDTQQKILEVYQQVLLLDMEYSLDQKVEQHLWNYGHKNFITALQSQAKDKDNPRRSEAQNMLNWFLDSASGFYLSLVGEVCSQFHLDLPFRRKDSIFGLSWPDKKYPTTEPQKSSCLYFCQHCLVHLGDIARYRSHAKQAETYYRHAVQLSPSSGQPYNQLALLAANKGDQLSTVFNYVRSMAVRHPFTAAGINLDKTLKRCATSQIQVDSKTCLSGPELVALFLKLHGLVKCPGKVDQAKGLVASLGNTLTALVATQNFSSWKLVQMLVINIYMHQEGNEQQQEVLLDLMATLLSACLLPVYTLAQTDTLPSYAALPFIKLSLEWIVMTPSVLLKSGFSEKKQIWPSFCHLLNSISKSAEEVDGECPDYGSQLPLPEDNDMQGFLPLQPYLNSLKFSSTSNDSPNMNLIRTTRLVQLGKKLTQIESKIVALDQSGKFVSIGQSQLEASEIIKKLEELNISQENHATGSQTINHGSSATSPVPSDTGSSWETGKSTPDSSGGSGSIHGVSDFQNGKRDDDLWPPTAKDTDNTEDSSYYHLPGRMNQNVAIQAILRGKQQNQNIQPPTTNGNSNYNGWKSPIDVSFQPTHSPNNSLFGGLSDASASSLPLQSNDQQFNLWGAKPVGESIWGDPKASPRPTSSPFGVPLENGEVSQYDKGYSLFSSTPAWCITGDKNQTVGKPVNWKAPEPVNVQPPLQSLWSGSSALERLLEQQKQQREGGT